MYTEGSRFLAPTGPGLGFQTEHSGGVAAKDRDLLVIAEADPDWLPAGMVRAGAALGSGLSSSAQC